MSNPLEEHHLWIRGGQVSDWVPSRVESRRLGRRLIRAGLITADQLDEAMRKQGEGKQPLGEILVLSLIHI